MRITDSSQYVGFTRNLNEIQLRRNRENVKLSTGKDLLNLSDSPEKVVDVKLFDKKIDQNQKYIDMLELTESELLHVDESIVRISDIINRIRVEANDASNEEPASMVVIGELIEGLMDDIIRIANSDFNGHYVFSGTKTTPNSITPEDPDSLPLPFELVVDEPSEENPSGRRVNFHGNNDDRIINKDQKTDQIINQKAAEMFGPNNEMFGLIQQISNTLIYNDQGELRSRTDQFKRTDLAKIDDAQRQLYDYFENLNMIASRNGNYINRIVNLRDQLTDENIRLKDYRSIREDADVAEAALNLRREETALQYALQVGARINQTSLFDFLR